MSRREKIMTALRVAVSYPLAIAILPIAIYCEVTGDSEPKWLDLVGEMLGNFWKGK